MLSQSDAKNLIDKVISYAKLPQCEADVNWTEDAFIRFANNGITTSGYRITQQVSISSVTEEVQARGRNAVVTELTDEALKRGASSRPRPWPGSPNPVPRICRRSDRRSIWCWLTSMRSPVRRVATP